MLMCRTGRGLSPRLPRQRPREEDKKLPILSFQSKRVTPSKDKLGLYPDSAPSVRMEFTFIFPSPRPKGSSSIPVERHRVTCTALQNSSGQTGYKHRVKLLLLFCQCGFCFRGMSARWGRLRTERWRRGWTEVVRKNLVASLFPGNSTHLPGNYCSNKGPALQLLLRVGSVQWQRMGARGRTRARFKKLNKG